MLETWNLYMDDVPLAPEHNGDGTIEVEFRVVPNSADDGDPEANAILAGLDLVDLIGLRDAIQQEIDTYALAALEAQLASDDEGLDKELMP